MAPASTKVTFADDLGSEIVDLFVGPERKRYVVHKKLLTEQSEYFHKALTGGFIEAEENSIHLKEEDTAAVALLVGWLYRGVIPGTGNLFTPFAKPVFSPSQTVRIPTSEQGTFYPFLPTPQPAAAGTAGTIGQVTQQAEILQHICQQSQYWIFSPEELRLADYKLNRKYRSDPFSLPTANAATTGPPSQAHSSLYGSSNSASLFYQPPQQPGGSSSGFGINTPGGSVGGSSLFDGFGTNTFAVSVPRATGGLFANTASPSSTSSQSGSQTNGGGLFGNASIGSSKVAQVSQPAFSFTQVGIQPSNLPHTGQLNAPQPMNMLMARYGSVTSNHNSNSSGAAPISQSQSFLPSAVNTSTVGSSNNPSSTVPAGNMFAARYGWATSNQTNNHSAVTPTSQAQRVYSGLVLPIGAVMTTIEPRKLKPGDFGHYHSIKHIQSPGHFVNGIPRSDQPDEHFFDLEMHQLALLNLCIMAETFCWPKLFNDAINAYIHGEQRLQRPISLDFIDQIYSRTHADSTLRAYVLDSLSRMNSEGVADLTPYLEIAQKHADLVADLFTRVMDSSLSIEQVTHKTIANYHMHGMGDDRDNQVTSS